MPKVQLNDIASLANETSVIATINANNAAVEEGFNNTVSRDGTSPNTMEAQIDMNQNRLINVPLVPTSNSEAASKYYVDFMVGQNPDTTPTNPSDAIIEGTLTVGGDANFNQDVTIDGNLTVSGSFIIPNRPVNVKDYGALGDGVTDDTAEILTALAVVVSNGGGILYFPKGTYLVSNLDAPASTWDNDVALHILNDNIHFVGDGRGATTIKLADSADAHVIKIGRRFEGALTLSDCSVRGMTIDGNSANQTAPSASEDHWNGIDVASGASRIILEDLYIHDTQYYGIGFQDGNFTDCVVNNVTTENTNADGIDCKNNGSTSYGNTISNMTVRSFGLASGLLSDQAGVDIYGGWHLNNITVTDYGTTLGKCGIRFQTDDGLFTQSTAPSLVNFFCQGDDSTDTMGLRINAHYGSISNGEIYNCETGFQINQRENKVNNVHIESCVTGFQFTDFGGVTATSCERNVLVNCVARSNTGTGFHIAGENQNALIGCIARSNDKGIDIDASATDTIIIGCTADANASIDVEDSGTRTTIILPSSIQLGSSITPYANNTLALGATTRQWSDLFLGEGGVINWDNGDLTITQNGNVLAVAGGDLIIGGLTSVPATSGGTVTHSLNTNSTAAFGGIGSFGFTADSNPTIISLAKSRNSTPNSHTVVQSGDSLGDIRFEGSDGTNFIRAAAIRASVDGTPGTNDMPGRLGIFTTPDGSATPLERLRINNSGAVTAFASLGGIGYGTGAGGTVTQATSKSTGVTLNTVSGAITMNNAALAANTNVTFTWTNSALAAGDIIVWSHESGGTLGAYNINAITSAGSAAVTVRNLTAGSLSEAMVYGFVVIKGVRA